MGQDKERPQKKEWDNCQYAKDVKRDVRRDGMVHSHYRPSPRQVNTEDRSIFSLKTYPKKEPVLCLH
jgi:hypothetical protein